MDSKLIVALICAGTFFMLTVTVTVVTFITLHRKKYLAQQNKLERIEFTKRQELLNAIIATQEEERNRIARNLHDGVSVLLSMHRFQISRISVNLKESGFNTMELEQELENFDETIFSMSSTCRELYPISLQANGFIFTFRELVQKMNRSAPFDCKYNISVAEAELVPTLEKKLGLLRVLQELLNNISKYSSCKKLQISFSKQETTVHIKLTHDGQPFTDKDADREISLGHGIGLTSISNRVILLSGNISYFSIPNGSEILITLPTCA